MDRSLANLSPPVRTLLGSGPSDVHPRVLRAMATPVLDHLNPKFLELMDETMELLRFVFQTQNRLTLAISGTGSAGMEAALVITLPPGPSTAIVSRGGGRTGVGLVEVFDAGEP